MFLDNLLYLRVTLRCQICWVWWYSFMMLIFLKYMLTFDLQALPPPPHIPPSLLWFCLPPPAVSDREPVASVQRSRGRDTCSQSSEGPLSLQPNDLDNPLETVPGSFKSTWHLTQRNGPCFHLSVWGYLDSFLQHKHWLRPQSLSVNLSSVCH